MKKERKSILPSRNGMYPDREHVEEQPAFPQDLGHASALLFAMKCP